MNNQLPYIPFENWDNINTLGIFELMLHHKTKGVFENNNCNVYAYIAAISLLIYKKDYSIAKTFSETLNALLIDFLNSTKCNKDVLEENIFIKKHKNNIFSLNLVKAINENDPTYMFNVIKCANKEHCFKNGIDLINNILLKEKDA